MIELKNSPYKHITKITKYTDLIKNAALEVC